MKVFISWSGSQSKRLAEAIREWLPSVIQLVTPYFTPSDIEKGSRWSTEIGRELSESQIGILCITRDNIHSDWILFEAGALSKSLEKSHVCPIIFGISNAELAGPLKQFQTTQFEKAEFFKLIGLINSKLGDHKLPLKTLENVFEKWWPDIEVKITEIMSESTKPDEPLRSDREILEEVLQLSRMAAKRPASSGISSRALVELMAAYIELHDDQANEFGGYQSALDIMKKMHRPIMHVGERALANSQDVDDLLKKISDLTYAVETKDSEDDIPF